MHKLQRRVLVLLHSDIRQEQRVNKEIETLREAGCAVFLLDLPMAGHGQSTVGESRHHHPIRLWTRSWPKNMAIWSVKYAEAVLRFVFIGLRTRPDVVLCVDRLTLIPGWIVSRICRVPYVYDSQEIWSEVSGPLNRPRVIWLAIERFLGRRARWVVVTDHFRSAIIGDALQLAPSRVRIVMNVPRISTLTRCERDLRSETGFRDRHVTIYAGAISTGRHLEDAILALQHLPAANTLVFVGFGDKNYQQQLVRLASNAGVASRFVTLPPVRWSDIPDFIAKADCALALYDRSSINNVYCSPSKLFDALIAGLSVVGTDNPLIVEVLGELGAGEVVKVVSPSSLAGAIVRSTERVNAARRDELRQAARARYSWESQERDLVHMFADVGAGS